jgi:hypothetical protein
MLRAWQPVMVVVCVTRGQTVQVPRARPSRYTAELLVVYQLRVDGTAPRALGTPPPPGRCPGHQA